MAYLQNLQVDKVSFVHKAANKRKFLLLKSDSGDGDGKNGDRSVSGSDNNQNNNQGDTPKMRKEVKTKLMEVVKSERSPEKVLGILKADTVLKLTEAEIGEVSDTLDVMLVKEDTPNPNPNPPIVQNQNQNQNNNNSNDVIVLKAENKALLDRLTAIEKQNKRRDIISWLQKECPYLPDDINKAADELMELEAVSPTAFESHKVRLQKSSAAIAQSRIFVEVGKDGDVNMQKSAEGAFELVRKVAADLTTLRKSDKPITVNSLVDIIKSHGDAYGEYRVAQIMRAKHEGL